MILPWLFLLVAFADWTECAKILGVFSIPMISHQIVFKGLMEALADRGHEVTVMTTDPVDYKGSYPNLKQIDAKNVSYTAWADTVNYNSFGGSDSTTTLPAILAKAFMKMTEVQLQIPEMMKLLNDPRTKFDLCFIESHVEPMFMLKDRFNCSLILISSLTGSLSNFDCLGSPSHPVLYPGMLSKYFGDMTFSERYSEVMTNIWHRLEYYLITAPKYDAFIKENFGPNSRSILDVQADADMLFLNGYPILSGVRPIVPGIIYMDNMHIKQPQPLPMGLKNILDQSTSGVVYFSLGSNVKSVNLDVKHRQAFIEAFKELPYTVLWKWEDDNLPEKPDNVHIMKWMPQQSILAHPNVKAFITQGGQQSLEEAINFKVPMICLPFLLDQTATSVKIVKFGIGTSLNLLTLSKTTIKDAILRVVTNPSYKQNVTKLSDLLKDQPQTGLERAVWWTEYVIRNKGAKHLQSPSARLPFYQYFFLDIIAYIVSATFFILFFITFFIKCIRRILHPQPQPQPLPPPPPEDDDKDKKD